MAQRTKTYQEHHPVPLSETMYLILAVLVEGPLHGYGILCRLEERSEGAHQMLTGTLYNALRRMQSQGLVAVEDIPTDATDEQGSGRGAPRTKLYRVTDSGMNSLRAEAHRMKALLRWTPADALAPAMEDGR